MLQSSCVAMDTGAVLEQMTGTVLNAASPERKICQYKLRQTVFSSQRTAFFTDSLSNMINLTYKYS